MELLNFHTHGIPSSTSIRSYYTEELPVLQDFFTIGIHPWHIQPDAINYQLLQVEELANHTSCVAIGECGLDRLTGADWKIQLDVLNAQLSLAQSVKKPLVFHVVKAYDELFSICKQHSDLRFAIHGFTGSEVWLQRFLDIGAYISIGPALLQLPHMPALLQHITESRLFIETDDKDPALLRQLYERVSEIKQISTEDLSKRIHQNFSTWKSF